MSDKSDTANKLIDVASQKMDQLGSKLAELTHQYGPDVVHGALQVARIDAFDSLMAPLVALLLCILFTILTVNLWKWAKQKKFDNYDPPVAVIPIATALVAIGLFIGAINHIIWPAIGVIEPKLWLAHKLLDM